MITPVIRTNYDPKPIPTRSHDWCAWYDGEEESYCAMAPPSKTLLRTLSPTAPMILN